MKKPTRRKSQWISVHDRLPEHNGKISALVHVLGEFCYPLVAHFDPQYGWRFHTMSRNGYNEIEHKNITHWMPIAQLPNTKKKDEQNGTRVMVTINEGNNACGINRK